MVHSVMYYRFDQTLWTDSMYDLQCKKLVQMMKDYPEEFKNSVYYEGYKDFDGTTGYHLPDIDIVFCTGKAGQLLRIFDKY